MRHFVQYHNADKMGYSCAGIEPNPLSIVTQKSVPDIRGEVVWILCGEGKPRRYGICARFIAASIEAEPDGTTIVGGDGTLLKREIPLNDEPWFKQFLSDYQNFSLGFREIKERKYIDELERLMSAAQKSRPSAPKKQPAERPKQAKERPATAASKARGDARQDVRTPGLDELRVMESKSRDVARQDVSMPRLDTLRAAAASKAQEDARPAPPSASPIADAPISIFMAYSHEDNDLRDALERIMKPLTRNGRINHWHYRQIVPGTDWKKEIDDNLSRAKIILLLISSHFLASDYCHEVELEKAMKRHKAGEAIVIPVILRPCLWDDSEFAKLQVLPTHGKPVSAWPNQDDALLDVARGVRAAIDKLRSRPSAP